MRKPPTPRAQTSSRPKSVRARRAPKARRLPYHHAAAFREAGHAVAAWEKGVMLMPMSIFASSKTAGGNVWNDPLAHVDFDWVRRERSPDLALRLAAILLAGPAAEKLLGPRLARSGVSLERIRDAKKLVRAASFDTKAAVEWRKTQARMELFLGKPRVQKAVTALAAALLQRGAVRGGRAAAIIETELGS